MAQWRNAYTSILKLIDRQSLKAKSVHIGHLHKGISRARLSLFPAWGSVTLPLATE
jgi:hypothetical protein